MKELFVDYELALKLKELGFNEKCFGEYYYIREHEVYDPRKGEDFIFGDNNRIILDDRKCHSYFDSNRIIVCNAPIWQQAISFLIPKIDGSKKFRVIIKKSNGNYLLQKRYADNDYGNYSDGTNKDCLEKLIEIARKTVEKI